MKIKLITIAAIAALIYSCASRPVSSPPPVVVPEESKITEAAPVPVIIGPSMPLTDAEAVVQGKVLYNNHCGNCHQLPDPASHTLENWKPIMVRMSREARLDEAETANVIAYLASEQK